MSLIAKLRQLIKRLSEFINWTSSSLPKKKEGPTSKEDQKRAESADTTSTKKRPATSLIPSSPTINIGLDFGTNSSKCVYRVLGGASAQVLSYGHDLSGIPNFCYPSAMTVIDGEFCWGPEAERAARNGIPILRSIKTCLTCRARTETQCRRGLPYCAYASTLAAMGCSESDLPPRVAATALLSQLLLAAKTIILTETGTKNAHWMVNICVPTSIRQDESIIQTYEGVIHHANRISSGLLENTIGQDFHVAEIASYLDSYRPPPKSDKMTWVVSEALAEVLAHVECNAMQPFQKYVLVDIGAGTTDVSFFFWNEHEIRWQATDTIPIAGDTIDLSMFHAIQDRHPALAAINTLKVMEATRHGKERWGEQASFVLTMNESPYKLDWPSAIGAATTVYNQLQAKYQQVWGQAYARDPGLDPWQNVKVIIGGGSSYLPGIRRVFCRPIHEGVSSWHEDHFPDPPDLEWGQLSGAFHRVAVAYGLSALFPKLPNEGFVPPWVEPPEEPGGHRGVIHWPDDPG